MPKAKANIRDPPNDFGTGTARDPIAQIALGEPERVIFFAPGRAFESLLQARKLASNLFETLGRDQIAIGTDRTVRQILTRFVVVQFFGETRTHARLTLGSPPRSGERF